MAKDHEAEATADCGKADPEVVSAILDAMPPHYGAVKREREEFNQKVDKE